MTKNVRKISILIGFVAASVIVAFVVVSSVSKSSASYVMTISNLLESRFPRVLLDRPRAFKGLVVLGGGPERLREAGQLARRFRHMHIVISGAGPAHRAIRQLGGGIPRHRISIDTRSRSTYQNAVNAIRLAAPRDGERWLLVTSAIHMPRSVATFAAQGFHVEAWPVHDLPASRLMRFRALRREITALVYYRLLGRIDTMLPSPVSINRKARTRLGAPNPPLQEKHAGRST